MDLAVALFVAAYLGVIPKSTVETFRHAVAQVPVVGQLFQKEPPRKPAPVKAAPAKKTK